MVMRILILIFFFEIKESKITRGHNFTLVKKQSRMGLRKYSFSQRTINVWTNYQLTVYMLVVLTCSRIEKTSISYRRVTHSMRAGYTYNSMSRLSMYVCMYIFIHQTWIYKSIQ